MKYLLFGGAPETGKTGAITRLELWLITTKRFTVKANWNYPPSATHRDFRVILERFDDNGNLIRIYINSATDTKQIIQDCKDFHDANLPVDITISSIRDVFDVRQHFFTVMEVDNTKDYILEVPLGKVRRGTHRRLCLNWYEKKIDNLVSTVLENNPFSL
ncbi:hypothetical protein CLU81_1218 [Flavobacterium sp. 9]|uniref:hypothetical protein n=1 Tax=Flavobacterium sp. 9 TaxID=2035198 RepID=UPI000C1A0486|nr:hypothetical protein [Flavobacterium sp. 9]PIF30769.1 hypothetical protein CLU81_1218 [Flavobacterium sp. 9]